MEFLLAVGLVLLLMCLGTAAVAVMGARKAKRARH
ncbi:hypothetical protein CLV35_2768 [Motilibacter peucedani]|uniref:Uncharacterized protein n=1 Tax=Motilibacter peucedani TaxID=598650 RepID=A0A420XMM1_9ACTN|nr:hypothetical protein CLV35_2768 [Motilibacter peucedani]